MLFNELPVLNGKVVSVEDMAKLVDLLDNDDLQGEIFTSSNSRGASRENCVYFFPKRGADMEANINLIKSIMDKYGVKSDIYVSHYHGVHYVVRIIIENADQRDEYRAFGNSVANYVTNKYREEQYIKEQKRKEAEKAARRAKIAKIIPIARLFQKNK